MAIELPDMSNLKDMAKALDGIAKGIDGYSEALTKMANSIKTDMDLSSWRMLLFCWMPMDKY